MGVSVHPRRAPDGAQRGESARRAPARTYQETDAWRSSVRSQRSPDPPVGSSPPRPAAAGRCPLSLGRGGEPSRQGWRGGEDPIKKPMLAAAACGCSAPAARPLPTLLTAWRGLLSPSTGWRGTARSARGWTRPRDPALRAHRHVSCIGVRAAHGDSPRRLTAAAPLRGAACAATDAAPGEEREPARRDGGGGEVTGPWPEGSSQASPPGPTTPNRHVAHSGSSSTSWSSRLTCWPSAKWMRVTLPA
jgi:hypothetical protein